MRSRHEIMLRKVGQIMPHETISVKSGETVGEVAERMSQTGYRRLPVVASNKSLTGLITSVDMLRFFSGPNHDPEERVEKAMNRHVFYLRKDDSVSSMLGRFGIYRKGGYPVLDGRHLYGMVTEFDLLRLSKPRGVSIAEAMTHKPMVIWPECPLHEASRIIIKGGTRRLPVMGHGVEGVITPHDILNFIMENGMRANALSTGRVRDVMVRNVFTAGPDDDVRHAASAIQRKRIGGMPVVHRRRLVGIITEHDIFRLIKTGLERQEYGS